MSDAILYQLLLIQLLNSMFMSLRNSQLKSSSFLTNYYAVCNPESQLDVHLFHLIILVDQTYNYKQSYRI